jgi:translation initiation factor IF-2
MAKKNKPKSSGSTWNRPPVVSILGHVDHGKTTLLDFIRKTRVSEKEVGGITQRVGAYQIEKPTPITFIDTPGHEAFSAMRSRGAQVADLAILVVAADDSVKPQTIESIKFIKKAKIPFIVAINKTDLPEVKVENVKKDLLKYDIATEGFGGDIVALEISAKSGKGIDELLEMINIVSQINLDLKADKKAPLKGVVIESNLDKRKGSLATVLVKEGTLNLKDNLTVGKINGRVKALFDEFGKVISEAEPSKPVVLLGLNDVVEIGAIVTRVGEESKYHESKQIKSGSIKQDESTKDGVIKLIVKADTSGTLESVITNLPKETEVLRAEVSDSITRSDIEYAIATKSAIIGYNVGVSNRIKQEAQLANIVLRTYELIYELLEEIDDVVDELTREPVEEVLGRAKVLATFMINDTPVAGVRVEEGKLKVGDKVKIEKDASVSRGKVVSIKEEKVEISQAQAGKEYGVGTSKDLDFTKGDVIIAYNIK